MTEKSVGRFPDDADREILGALLGGGEHRVAADRVRGRAALALRALARGVRAPPAAARPHRALPPALPSAQTWQQAPADAAARLARAALGAPPAGGGGSPTRSTRGTCTASCASGEEEVTLAEIDAFLEGGFAVAGGRLGRVDDGGASSWLGMLLTHPRVRITPPRRAAFLEELYSLPSPPPLDLPGGLALPEVAAEATPRLLVHAPEATPGGAPIAAAAVRGPSSPSSRSATTAWPSPRAGPGRWPSTRRGCASCAATASARRRPPRASTSSASRRSRGARTPPPPEGAHLALPPARLPAIVAALVAEGWRVEAQGRAYRQAARAVRLAVASGVDWLDLTGIVDFGGFAAPLPAVLDALRRGANARGARRRIARPPAGEVARAARDRAPARRGARGTSSASRRARRRCSRSSRPPRRRRTSRGASTSTRRSRRAGARRSRREACSRSPRRRPRASAASCAATSARGSAGCGRSSARGSAGCSPTRWGSARRCRCSRTSPGAGAARPSLVVAPRSLVFNWKREAARFAPHLRLLDHTGADRRPPGAHFAEHDLVLTTYGTLRRDADALAAVGFDYVILDEAQAIKNDASETARAARRLPAAHRLALSGTPVENHLGELWSLVEFLNPGLLGRAAAWRAATATSPSPEAVALLGRAIQPFLLRRTKAEVAPDLPARMEETWVCELDAPRARALRGAARPLPRRDPRRSRERRRARAGRRPGRGVLEALLRLRQAACHPGLARPCAPRRARAPSSTRSSPSSSRSATTARRRSSSRSSARCSTSPGPRSRPRASAAPSSTGRPRDREAVVARFQEDPACSVLLVSLKAGGVGLNLTAAEYVFLLDPWWNPAAEAQAIDRAHRIGPDAGRLRLPPHRPGHRRGADRGAASAEALARGERHPRRRRAPPRAVDGRRGPAVVLTLES